MLLFLNFDCVLCVPADAAGPRGRGDTGIRRLESVLHAWPSLRIVVTSDRRYHWTLEHFQGFLAPEFQHRVVATTLLYSASSAPTRRTREGEIFDWLELLGLQRSDWLAVDSRETAFEANTDRLLICQGFTTMVCDDLHTRLLARVDPPETSHDPAYEVIRTAGALTRRRVARYVEPPIPTLPTQQAGGSRSKAPALRSP